MSLSETSGLVSVLVNNKCVATQPAATQAAYMPSVGHIVCVNLYDDDENLTTGLGLVVRADTRQRARILWFYSRAEMSEAGCREKLAAEYTLTDDIADVDPSECERHTGSIDKNEFVYLMGAKKFTALPVRTLYHIANTHGHSGAQKPPRCFDAGHGAGYRRAYATAVSSFQQFASSMRSAAASVYGNKQWYTDIPGVESSVLWLNDIRTAVAATGPRD